MNHATMKLERSLKSCEDEIKEIEGEIVRQRKSVLELEACVAERKGWTRDLRAALELQRTAENSA